MLEHGVCRGEGPWLPSNRLLNPGGAPYKSMNTRQRLADRKAILKVTLQDLVRHKICAAEANSQLRAVMLKIFTDPAKGHLHYCEVGRLYVERERSTTRADLTQGSCLTLRKEIETLKSKLANE